MPIATNAPASTLALSRYVEKVRAVTPVAGESLDVEHLPDGRTSLVLRVLDGGRQGDVCVAGPRMRAVFKHTAGVVSAVMVQFKPGWSTLLVGAAAHALTDRIVSLEDLWGRAGRDLCHELLAAPRVSEVLDRLSAALLSRVPQTSEPSSALLARRAIPLLEADEARVDRVADQLGVTARHLRRAFKENVGIGPKDFVRSARLQRAVQGAATSTDWGRIAADAGYYDQAHLIADFRELVGFTPGAFLKRAGDSRLLVASRKVA